MKPYLMGMASGGPWQVPSMPLGTELPGSQSCLITLQAIPFWHLNGCAELNEEPCYH